MFSRRQELEYAVLVVAWLACSAYFWRWWLTPGQAGGPVLYVMTSLCLFYGFTLLPSFYLFYLGWMRRPVHVDVDQVEKGVIGRVAVITLTVPGSEALSIVRRQLSAMRDLSYPHDNWVLVDGRHSPEIARLAGELGVRYFCRHDEATWGATAVDRWNQHGPPFQSRTKSGNVNAWLDAHGGEYSHFTQLDIDHHPVPDYLERVLGFFRNRRVAWVQAPSVYGNHEHWPARGSSEQEFVLQGPLQMGFFGFCRTPFIIGSHCTYDMEAVREIGGFQPTRAEDHLNTVRLAAMGYEGVFLPEVIAVGDGPESFDAYLSQQFAWAYSMIEVLFHFTPRLIRRYTPRQAVQFLFVQTWYTCWSLATLLLFTTPLLSLVSNTPVSRVSLWQFLLHSWPAALTATASWVWSRPWQHPHRLRLSWRSAVLQVARWVTVLRAFIAVVLGVTKPYMITEKGLRTSTAPPFRLSLLAPYAGLALASLAACWWYLLTIGGSATQGMLFFALEGALLFTLLIVVVLYLDVRALVASGTTWREGIRLRSRAVAMAAALTMLVLATVVPSSGLIWRAVVG